MDETFHTIDFEIRDETQEDYRRVFEIHKRAFGSDTEPRLVDRLRVAAEPSVSLVAVVRGEVAGHILFSPVRIESPPDQGFWMGLGPMAVIPELQNHGIGSALVKEGLERCRGLGVDAVFVLGHADYYPRFGFKSAAKIGLRYKDERYDPYFFVIEMRQDVLAGSSGLVTYNRVFEEL